MSVKQKKRRPDGAKITTKPNASEEVPFAAKFRDIVEQIAIAVGLALLFRGFEGEAFVIPTGSMAPTLMGMHKDIPCDKCGHEIRTGATEERERQAGQPVRCVVWCVAQLGWSGRDAGRVGRLSRLGRTER